MDIEVPLILTAGTHRPHQSARHRTAKMRAAGPTGTSTTGRPSYGRIFHSGRATGQTARRSARAALAGCSAASPRAHSACSDSEPASSCSAITSSSQPGRPSGDAYIDGSRGRGHGRAIRAGGPVDEPDRVVAAMVEPQMQSGVGPLEGGFAVAVLRVGRCHWRTPRWIIGRMSQLIKASRGLEAAKG